MNGGYTSNPQPHPATLPILTHSEIVHVHEDSRTHTRDIYTCGATVVRPDGASAVMEPVLVE